MIFRGHEGAYCDCARAVRVCARVRVQPDPVIIGGGGDADAAVAVGEIDRSAAVHVAVDGTGARDTAPS